MLIDGRIGSLYLDLRKESRNNGKVKIYSSSEVDAIYIYVPLKEVILKLPPKDFENKNSLTFRDSFCKNNQSKNIRMMKDFVWKSLHNSMVE